MTQFTCRRCGSVLPQGSPLCPNCGKDNAEDETLRALIPNNKNALISYYTGIFSLFGCFMCLPLGIIPIIYGFKGLSYTKKNPEAKGAIHAWVGIILGFLTFIFPLFELVCVIISTVAEK